MANERTASGASNFDNSLDSEITEIQPVILGGSPTDPANKVVLSRQQHIEAVRYWNRLISELRKSKGNS